MKPTLIRPNGLINDGTVKTFRPCHTFRFLIPDKEKRFSGFPILTEYIDGADWKLVRDVSYQAHGGRLATVRSDFIFDWASVPRIFWILFPPSGLPDQPYGIAALFHDWLYKHHEIEGRPIERVTADLLFYEIMLYTGVDTLIARAMYRAVRLGGWWSW